jgi:hypothetical protein
MHGSRLDLRENTEAREQEGIYVLNRSNLVQESHFRGRFRCCVESSKDGSYIAAIDSDSGAINILSMDSGTLAHIRTFAVPREADFPGQRGFAVIRTASLHSPAYW